MSLWYCPEHGLVGPMPYCPKSSLATMHGTGHAMNCDCSLCREANSGQTIGTQSQANPQGKPDV